MRARRRGAAGAGAAALGVLPAAWTLYLAVLSVAALRRTPAAPGVGAAARLVVLVPAHDEQELLGRCLDSLAAQDLPASSYRLVVVADNCTDRTADVARGRGAEVLVRTDPTARGKGQALAWAVRQLEAASSPWDAVVVVDADSVADPGLLSGLVAEVERGAQVVQGEYLVLPDGDGDGVGAELRAAAFLLFHRVRFRGRAALGLPCSLVGNGMLFTRGVLRDRPWRAFSSTEDLEHTLDLRLAGVRPVFAAHARVRAPVLSHGAGAAVQRSRWEGGRAHLVRTRLPGLVASAVRRPRRGLWDAALDLSVPPLGLLAPGVAVGALVSTSLSAVRLVPPAACAPWLVSAVALPVHVLVGLRAAEAPASTWSALWSAPGLVARDLVVRLRLLRGTGADTWTRTQRPGEVDGPPR